MQKYISEFIGTLIIYILS